jgi:glutamate dehydrogenase (NAD(P)+)
MGAGRWNNFRGSGGAAVVRYFSEAGGDLRAVSDPRIGGSYFLEQGASPALVEAIAFGEWERTKALLESEGRIAPLDAVLYQPVDILFPSAVQEVITAANVGQIQAKRIVEGANNPCTAEARTALFERGVLVLPDFIVNAGGIIAAFVEMSSPVTPEENAKTRAKVKEAKDLTRKLMRAGTQEIFEIARSAGVEPSIAGRYRALRSIFNRADAAAS